MKQFIPIIGNNNNNNNNNKTTRVVIVCCAGENDVGNGIPVETSLRAMDTLLETLEKVSLSHSSYHHMIFLGPKLEPWLEDDIDSRKHYVQLSKGFRRRCEGRKYVTFCDCLTMFYGETATRPGAVLGGRARADPKFFNKDQLHLNEEGYRIWKQVVEQELAIITSADIQGI